MVLTMKEVVVCNQSLARLGSKRFTYANQATEIEGIQSELIYTQTRNALERSFEWPFCKDRKTLAPETNTPDFDEWDYRFKLPDNYLRMRSDYGIDDSYAVDARFAIEGDCILSNNDEIDLKYIKKVTDPDDFDPLFTEVLILTLAKKLIPALPGTKAPTLLEDVARDLAEALSRARTVCRQESNTSGRSDWNLSRLSSKTV